ncbi:MAG: hypothetical protein BAJALOKI1v1_590025 [Promethearchaeota archaeon]|nr:MAG: hypothetical protein BAJALOKI1v1_590025 [Candidatus Lokiarchaeota archaeon]
MNEKQDKQKRKYDYRYIQFTVSPKEKDKIEEYMKKENYKTQSDFIRRLIFEHIRKQENPELFIATDDSNINPIVLERIAKNVRDIQQLLSQREEALEEMKRMITTLHTIAERNALAKERTMITVLLQMHTSLSLKQIQEETNLPEDVVFKVISDMNLFKITAAGRFALR